MRRTPCPRSAAKTYAARGIRAEDRDALDLFVDRAEGRERVDLHRRRVGFAPTGAPDAERFSTETITVCGGVVDDAGPDAAAERDATHEAPDAAVTPFSEQLLEICHRRSRPSA